MTSPHSTHATTVSSNGWSTKRIAILAMLCAAAAISTMVLQFPLIPGVTFLKYDPSGVFALLAGVAFGPAAGAIVSVRNLRHYHGNLGNTYLRFAYFSDCVQSFREDQAVGTCPDCG